MLKQILHKNILWLTLFSMVYLIEFILFKKYISLEIIDLYPVAFDQTSYLKIVYTSYEKALKEGILAGLQQTSTANSILFIPQTVLFFLLFGATRFNALMLNFLFFLILQTSLIYLTRWLSGRYFMAAISIGILLTLSVPFHLVGGMIDFRIDFITFCAYGVFIITLIRSDIFLYKKWSILASLIAAYMILTRCLTSTYVFLLIGVVASYLLISLYVASDNQIIIKHRLKNLFLFCCILGALTLPFLWFHKNFIYDYYVSLGAIKEVGFRNLETQTTDLWSILTYYPNSVFMSHMGTRTLKTIAILFFITLFCFAIKRHKIPKLNYINSLSMVNFFLILSFIIPIIILTCYPSKSPSVGSIMVVPAILFFVINAITFLNHSSGSHKLLFFLAVVFLLGGLYQWWENTHRTRNNTYHTEIERLAKMYDDIGEYIELNQWTNPYFSTDQVSDYLSSLILTDLYYERHKKLLTINTTPLGSTVFPITEAQAITSLLSSNIYITNSKKYPHSVYPFNISINEMRPALSNIAEQQFIKLGEYSFRENYYYNTDHYFHVYVKPDFMINEKNNALTLTMPWQVANRTSKIIISGKSKLKELSSSQLITEVNDIKLQNSLTAALSIHDYEYQITVTINQKHKPLENIFIITLQFPENIKQHLYAPISKKVMLIALSS